MGVQTFLCLGSNQGDSLNNLLMATRMLDQEAGILVRSSSIYQTAAWGNISQPDFLNQIVLLDTPLTARELLDKILEIELVLGRERKERWGARTIDIDILFFGNDIIDRSDLAVPHPRLHLRKFVLMPLAEIAPLYVHPVLKKTANILLRDLEDDLLVKKLP